MIKVKRNKFPLLAVYDSFAHFSSALPTFKSR